MSAIQATSTATLYKAAAIQQQHSATSSQQSANASKLDSVQLSHAAQAALDADHDGDSR